MTYREGRMAAADDETKLVIPGDNPITSAKDDALGRVPTAEVLASEIRVLDASEGYVVGVLGPWGSGKTSLINLVKSELAKSPAIPAGGGQSLPSGRVPPSAPRARGADNHARYRVRHAGITAVEAIR